MALTTGSTITAGDYNAVRTRVNDELSRRRYNPNLSSGLNVGTAASSGSTITSSGQGAQLISMANKITGQGYNAGSGAIIYQLNTLYNNYGTYSGDSYTSSTTHCASSCAGLCQGGCATNCSGCSGGCSGCSGCGGCDGGCAGHCTSCHGGCSGSNVWHHG